MSSKSVLNSLFINGPECSNQCGLTESLMYSHLCPTLTNENQDNFSFSKENSKENAFHATENPPWIKESHYFLNSNQYPLPIRLSYEISDYIEYTNSIIQSISMKTSRAIELLSTRIQHLSNNTIQASCFGSFANGLWLPSSDVDIVLKRTCMGMASTRSQDIHDLLNLVDALKQESWIDSIECIDTAKIPRIKLIEKNSFIHIDIIFESIDTQRGLYATTFIFQSLYNMPLLYPLAMILKQFLREVGLNTPATGGLSSYTIVLLCIHLIQMKSDEIIQAPIPQYYNGGIECNIGQLLLDFLEYYGCIFDWRKKGISIVKNMEYDIPLDNQESTYMTSTLVVDDPIQMNTEKTYNVAASSFAYSNVRKKLESAYYGLIYHQHTKFKPTPLCELIHHSGYAVHERRKRRDSVASNVENIMKVRF